MSTNANSAQQFFEACETGKGWEACSAFCHPDATFSSQTATLSDISTLEVNQVAGDHKIENNMKFRPSSSIMQCH
jgi:hypothetical protein